MSTKTGRESADLGPRVDPDDELGELYVDPLAPFAWWETALCACLLWPVAIVHMASWLVVFVVIDRLFVPGWRLVRLPQVASSLVTLLLGIRVRKLGIDRLEPRRSYVFCHNHVSLLDTPVLVQSVPFHTRAFQDIAHFRIPIYGGFVRTLGQLPVSRDDRELNERSYARAAEMLRAGSCFAVFPEGHRTRDGRLGRFFPGAFRLAIEAGVPVVPVVTRGLRRLCPAKEWRIRPGSVDVIFGEPIPTRPDDDPEELARRVRAAMNELLRRGA